MGRGAHRTNENRVQEEIARVCVSLRVSGMLRKSAAQVLISKIGKRRFPISSYQPIPDKLNIKSAFVSLFLHAVVVPGRATPRDANDASGLSKNLAQRRITVVALLRRFEHM